ncbi:MAG: hypothetical protein ACJ763_05080 [Bdellovibrionia bacterium]
MHSRYQPKTLTLQGTQFAVQKLVRPKNFSVFAICCLLALSAYELYHFIQGEPWPGYTPVVNYISFFFLAIFLTGCYQLARYQMRRPVFPMIAFVAAIIHGIVIRVGSGWQGYFLIPVGAALLISGFATLNSRTARLTRADDFRNRRAA